jgi:hypothetical protein
MGKAIRLLKGIALLKAIIALPLLLLGWLLYWPTVGVIWLVDRAGFILVPVIMVGMGLGAWYVIIRAILHVLS